MSVTSQCSKLKIAYLTEIKGIIYIKLILLAKRIQTQIYCNYSDLSFDPLQ